ncbi:heterokaryon incompatibility protein-domain-containing protein [Paraphoma chrysanthemicola]|uniref:Heterokaryon incompatibility protein-domain-containing protein n=1 Tax=Paraphoma chrysanthemicola TaxID=798071 RepID=A0A8K0QXR9_9PLEO|nr:heterokaryon incompatibility protein-domain-containing protein [Paraphoma chrysanthemicola]
MAAIKQLYASHDIDTGSKSIRILDLQAIPGGAADDMHDLLDGSLRVVDLDSHPMYNALSYVWGEETADDPTIRIDGVNVRVTRNCYDALLQIRKRFGSTGIWVDAICIHQADIEERARQVEMMGLIYRKAREVLVWLGAHESVDHALLFLRDRSQSDGGIVDLNDWDKLSGLLLHDWWRRAWTFQELVLARDPVILTSTSQMRLYQISQVHFRNAGYSQTMGIYSDSKFRLSRRVAPDSVHQMLRLIQVWRAASLSGFGVATNMRVVAGCIFLMELLGALYWVYLLLWGMPGLALTFFFMLGPAFQLLFLLYYDRTWTTSTNVQREGTAYGTYPGTFPDVRYRIDWRMTLNHILSVRICQALFKIFLFIICRVMFYKSSITWRQIHREAIYHTDGHIIASDGILEALRTRQCRDPVDHAYALHGVLRKFGARFTKVSYATAEQDVYFELFRDLLTWRWVSLSLLLDAGSPDCSLPSWVPQWDSEYRTTWVPEGYVYTGTSTTIFTQIRTLGLPVHELTGTSLTVWGTRIGFVAYCVHLPEVCQPNTMQDCIHAILSWHWNMQYFGLRSKTTDAACIQSMHRILQLRSLHSSYELLVRILTGGTDHQPTIMSKLDIDKLHPSNAGQVLTLLRDCDKESELQALCDPICGKRLLFITEDGEIGTGPLWTEPRDTVHRISGLPLPMILRKQDEEDAYRVVGAAMTSHKQEQGFSWLRRLERITLV